VRRFLFHVRIYIRDQIRTLFQINDPPHKLALAFAIGVFIAFSPTIGLHVISCLFLAWALRLSKMVILTASLINNPWTILPLYGFCTWFGSKVIGSDISVPIIAWDKLTFLTAYDIVRPYIWPFVAGTLVLGTAAAFLSYFLFLFAVKRYRGMSGR